MGGPPGDAGKRDARGTFRIMTTTKKTYRRFFGRRLGYIAFFLLFGTLIYWLLLLEESPDKRIIGKWRETSWRYELVNGDHDTITTRMIAEDAREQIARELIIHEAETWEFKKDGTLLLHRKDFPPTRLRWTLKGRGHVLQIDHDEKPLSEFYDLEEVNDERMVLYVDIEIQAKGIVRMSFEKTT
jgi:hypothetical protein